MSARGETLNMLKNGKSPGEISRERSVSLETTLGYLNEMVGEGALRRSDIFFSIPKKKRELIRSKLADQCTWSKRCKSINSIKGLVKIHHKTSARDIKDQLECDGSQIDDNLLLDDICIVLLYGDAESALGDMYEDLSAVEVGLHKMISCGLEIEYGPNDWWRNGVPRHIRETCGGRRESEDSNPAPHAYHYTDLIDLKEILDRQWNVLNKQFPKSATENKRALLLDFVQLNEIRRKVMHPVRGQAPTEEDFDFLRNLKSRLGIRRPNESPVYGIYP